MVITACHWSIIILAHRLFKNSPFGRIRGTNEYFVFRQIITKNWFFLWITIVTAHFLDRQRIVWKLCNLNTVELHKAFHSLSEGKFLRFSLSNGRYNACFFVVPSVIVCSETNEAGFCCFFCVFGLFWEKNKKFGSKFTSFPRHQSWTGNVQHGNWRKTNTSHESAVFSARLLALMEPFCFRFSGEIFSLHLVLTWFALFIS